uniref:Uncharacterized protein n=1 Tax=Glossina pallidipes TaxID=7398 RepID=A0A1A9ZYP6_GLOPL
MQHSISSRLKQFNKTNNHLPESGIYNRTTINSEQLEAALVDGVTRICRVKCSELIKEILNLDAAAYVTTRSQPCDKIVILDISISLMCVLTTSFFLPVYVYSVFRRDLPTLSFPAKWGIYKMSACESGAANIMAASTTITKATSAK